jgi:hypothetical protein
VQKKDDLAGRDWPRKHWLRLQTTVADVESDFEEGWRSYWRAVSTPEYRDIRDKRVAKGITTEDEWVREEMRTNPVWQEWERIKSAMREGDELWRFAGSLTPYADLAMMKFYCGIAVDLAMRAGTALVRNGEVVDFIIEAMS